MNPTINEIISSAIGELRITVIYDNNPYKEGLITSWGFACVIYGAEKTILFDTGGNSAVLLDNMQQLGMDPKEIDVVVLSHIHGDHIG
jgi:7,8-dihydropterin-6-yl-methyl-4-(beta-D-ribofuranosyl)aminobenzene 5'-phosphate synthase